jgi:hypothetical protein
LFLGYTHQLQKRHLTNSSIQDDPIFVHITMEHIENDYLMKPILANFAAWTASTSIPDAAEKIT